MQFQLTECSLVGCKRLNVLISCVSGAYETYCTVIECLHFVRDVSIVLKLSALIVFPSGY